MTTASRASQAHDVQSRRVTDSGTAACFIEKQFPVSKLSKESYAERTAKQSQTLTGLGKWWGRKPLVLCRSTILGLLLPVTGDPAKDREVFLRLLTMDDDGMLRRKSINIPASRLFDRLGPQDRSRYFGLSSSEEKVRFKRGISAEDKEQLQKRVFLSLSYDERLEYCDRPEQIDGPSVDSWRVINGHLGTQASSLPELVAELGKRRFGRVPRVGDSFCGGGSIPFEAARLGCESYGSDLNPVGALLTWGALNLVGGGSDVVNELNTAQQEVFAAVDREITQWGIEHREPDPKTRRRWRADAYLYCAEATCPECGWRIPLAPSWVIGKGTRTIARLVPDKQNRRYDVEILTAVSKSALDAASSGTVKDLQLVCPCKAQTPLRVIRGDGRGTFGDSKSLLRPWENADVVPRENDIFGERLYCVRWVDAWVDHDGKMRTERHYRAPTATDLAREGQVLDLLLERFAGWQAQGVLPSRKIEPGTETSRLARERGWIHWHHLFTPRQLLTNGLLLSKAREAKDRTVRAGLLILSGRVLDWNSRLCRWHNSAENEKTEQTFFNQALNTLFNYGVRPVRALDTTWLARLSVAPVSGRSSVQPLDARAIDYTADLWITDPPYADAVNYEELSEFFLAWYEHELPRLFPDWYSDSKRALAVRGSDESFRSVMVDCYRRLASHMTDNGLQAVMFTHQDAGVWADLALILWAAGLRVTAAWCIATETTSALKSGNYVQGTVLLVLRKQRSTEKAFLDEVYPEVEAEVRQQLDSMLALAAYAAALRVLTAKRIEEIDVADELQRSRPRDEISPVEQVIRNAVRIACDHLVPRGIDSHLWKSLSSLERLYLKGIEMESHGERRSGVYQELLAGALRNRQDNV